MQRSLGFVPALIVLVLATCASARAAPHGATTTSFAAAGAPRAEEASSEEPAAKPESDRAPSTEHDLALPDDVPTTPPQGWGYFQKHCVTLEAHLGFGTPVGVAGLMLEYSILPQLSVAAGAGLGSGPKNALHGAIAVRARPVSPGDHDTAVLEAAFSTGGYQRFELGSVGPPADGPGTPTPVGPSATWAHFLQFEVAWEHRSDKGLLIRLGGGFATMLNPGALRCPSGDSSSNECAALDSKLTELLAVFDFAVGQSF